MNQQRPCRVIHDPPAPGGWNMAVDEALLEIAIASGEPTLRFYQWSEPTLSLGYFQGHVDRETHSDSLDLPAVRRCTGGGALVHHHEQTYSLVLPPDDPRTRDPVALTCTIHQALISAIEEVADSDLDLGLWDDTANLPRSQEPFLCFERRSQGDVIVNGEHKVCGSAQRRRRGALLQHGGVLISATDGAPELSGLADLAAEPDVIEEYHLIGQICRTWEHKVLEGLNLTPLEEGLAEVETELAMEILLNREAGPHRLTRR